MSTIELTFRLLKKDLPVFYSIDLSDSITILLRTRLNISHTSVDMSENIPESIPTSADPRSKRPTKKRALTPASAQSSHIEALFAKPDLPLNLPSGPKPKTLAPPPEIVANVQGSSAGAGSGEFHVYKASRRREYERIRQMEEEVSKEKADEEFQRKQGELRRKDEEKTGKNRKRREKMKMRKGKENAGEGGADGQKVNGRETNAMDLSPGRSTVEARSGERGGEQVNGDAQVTASEEVGILIHDED